VTRPFTSKWCTTAYLVSYSNTLQNWLVEPIQGDVRSLRSATFLVDRRHVSYFPVVRNNTSISREHFTISLIWKIIASFNSTRTLGDISSAPGDLPIRNWLSFFVTTSSSMKTSDSLSLSLPWNMGSAAETIVVSSTVNTDVGYSSLLVKRFIHICSFLRWTNYFITTAQTNTG